MEQLLKQAKNIFILLFIGVLAVPTTVLAQTPEIDATLEAIRQREQEILQSQAAGAIGGITPDQQTVSQAGASITGGVAECAVGNLVGETLRNYLSNSLTSAVGGLVEREVPVKPVKQDQKEVATTVGNVAIFPSWDSIAFCLVNSIIDHIGRSTVRWIESGFQGNPVFVDDPEQFFRDFADLQAGGFIDGLGGGFLCEPFDVKIRLALLREYTSQYAGPQGFGRCTLTDVVDNVDGFLEGNFEQGGWRGWFELTQDPANNIYGSQYYANRALRNTVQTRRNLIELELGWGEGFLSFKDPETGKTTTPGRLIEDQINNRLNSPEQRLQIADEFDEVINALVNQLVKIALNEITSIGQ